MLPDIQPGNTKILYFFNCLLDGMHTIIILFCVYLCGYVYFSVHFLPKTIINGNRCGMKTVKEGNDLEKKRMRDYQIIMRLNNSECILMNKDVPYVRSDVRSEMKDILKKQKNSHGSFI